MRNFRDISIKRKLTLIIMLTSSAALLLTCAAFVIHDQITFRRVMVRNLSILTEMIGYNIQSSLIFDYQADAEETLKSLSTEPHIVSSCLYKKYDYGQHEVFATYIRDDVSDDVKRSLLLSEPQEEGYRFEDAHLVLFRSVVDPDSKKIIGTIYIRSDMQELYSRQKWYACTAVIIMLMSSFVALILSHKLQRIISEPILGLVQTMRVVSANKNYSIQAVKYSEDEVGLLIDGFNEMLAQIQRREEELRKSEEMYRTIFETTGTAAIMIEEDTTISLANTEFEKLSGYSKAEIEGKKSWTEFIPKVHLERMKQYHRLRRIEPDAAPTNYESQFIHREGNIRDCLITVSMIPGTKKSIGFIVDITEHKEEAERIQAAKMESLRQLVAGVAHQMNNPIGVIASNNDVSNRAIGKIKDIIIEEYSQEFNENGQLLRTLAAMEKINQTSKIASERIAKIVATLRRFVRLDEAEWQFADIHEGIDNVIALMEMEPEFKSRIRITKDYDDIPKIYCSPSSLNQVFASLFKNASEAILCFHRNSALAMETNEGEGEIKIRTFAQQEQVNIEISDTGKGIPAENLDRIFDPGFTTKGVKVGVGLGLPICYQIVVNEHKGSIDVASELGEGTTFTITLPKYRDGKQKTQ